MKRLLVLLSIISATMFVACSKDDDPYTRNPVQGERQDDNRPMDGEPEQSQDPSKTDPHNPGAGSL